MDHAGPYYHAMPAISRVLEWESILQTFVTPKFSMVGILWPVAV